MVLYDNKVKDVSGMENHAKRPEILKASRNGEGSSSRIFQYDPVGDLLLCTKTFRRQISASFK